MPDGRPWIMPYGDAGLDGEGAGVGQHTADYGTISDEELTYQLQKELGDQSSGTAKITIPKGIRQHMPPWFEETRLGYPMGSTRQYRFGRLHVHEYEDRYVAHMDNANPRYDPLGHLVKDAPEVLIGLGGAAFGGKIVADILRSDMPRGYKIAAVIASSIAGIAATYMLSKKFKEPSG
ncbi:hypothetical protein CENSYa_1508 [Cenarchaeum symbiosum A]|uniref:Uncharacterized protein n=1 Tax=Cenarchaeum symbiosum (strain A) TaxID=414004 RepID=A0RXR3_CENSY|nr:hypothetical protein CENSYa_1508 [Cenarchaeum symbiosum A]